MFQSYEYIKHLGYDEKTKQYSCQYKIIDSDFKEVGVALGLFVGVAVAVGVEVAVAVIDTYEKRNLNVAANLMLVIIYISKEYGVSVQQIINYNKQYNPKFAQYEEDLEKYMVLI